MPAINTFTRSTADQEEADRYTPLKTNISEPPTLLIDTHAPLADIQECADIRIRAATNMLESLTCMGLSNTCDRDLARFANVAYLLLRDGMDLLEVVSARQRVCG